MSLGFGELMVVLGVLVFLVVSLGLVIWNVVDVWKRYEAALEAAGQNRTVWLGLPLALMVVGVGWILSIVYFLAIRPKVVAASPI